MLVTGVYVPGGLRYVVRMQNASYGYSYQTGTIPTTSIANQWLEATFQAWNFVHYFTAYVCAGD